MLFRILRINILIITLLGILWFIYVRFLMGRLPHAFLDMTEYQKICLILTTLGIGTSLVIQIRNIYAKTQENKWLKPIKDVIKTLLIKIYQVLIEIYELLWYLTDKFIIYPYSLLIIIARFIYKKHNNTNMILIILLVEMLPKIIFHLALIIDVLYLKTFNYSYKCITLLLLPYIMPGIIFILSDFYRKYNRYSSNMINMEEQVINGKQQTLVSFKEEFKDYIDITEFLKEHYLVIINITYILNKYENLKYNTLRFLYFNMLLSLLKLLLFVYILYTLDFTFIYK